MCCLSSVVVSSILFAKYCVSFTGRVIDQGGHSALMNRNDLYCTLIQTWLQEKKEECSSTNPEMDTPIE